MARILHLASEFPPARIFGLGRYVHDLSRAQARRGHDVHVLTNSLSGKDQESIVHGVTVHRINFPSPPKPPDGATQVTQFNLCIYERAQQLSDALRGTDVLISHDWLTALSGHLLRKCWGARLVLTMHDTIIGKTFGKLTNEDKYIANIERWACQQADATIAVSSHVRRELETVYQAPKDKLHVVPCGVDKDWFGSVSQEYLPDLRRILISDADPLIAYVGRLDPEKGVNVLLQAMVHVLKSFPNARLAIGGKGLEQDSLEQQARTLGVEPQVRFLGYLAGPALETLYKISDVLVCPSTYEPFGIVPLEGMTNGLPVVASDTGGMSEIVVHGETGIKVRPGDEGELARAISFLLGNRKERIRLGAAGRKRAEELFNWDRVAEGVEPAYLVKQLEAVPVQGQGSPESNRRPKLTAGIRVKNGERFAEECLRDLSAFVDEIVILDDGSTDRTIEICRSFPKVTQITRWEKDFFHEGIDRNVVLALAKNTNPDWILLPDIDEVFESRFKQEIRRMMEEKEVGMYAFLFCHFWRCLTHYRVDGKWGRETSSFPIPRLVRNQPSLQYPVHRPLGTAQITGVKGKVVMSDIRVKHYGHLYEDISKQKVKVYSALDPGVDYSFMVDETGLELEEWKDR